MEQERDIINFIKECHSELENIKEIPMSARIKDPERMEEYISKAMISYGCSHTTLYNNSPSFLESKSPSSWLLKQLFWTVFGKRLLNKENEGDTHYFLTQQPPAKAGGFVLWTESPDTRQRRVEPNPQS